jgi:hypothetical protein
MDKILPGALRHKVGFGDEPNKMFLIVACGTHREPGFFDALVDIRLTIVVRSDGSIMVSWLDADGIRFVTNASTQENNG